MKLKPLSFSEYKKLIKCSYNQVNAWYMANAEAIQQEVMAKMIGEDADEGDVYVHDEDEIRDILRSVGIQPHCIEVIISKLEA